MLAVKKSMFSSFLERGVLSGFAKPIAALALGLCGVLSFASVAVAQVSGVTHQNPDYPTGPPYSSTPAADTFKYRDLRDELRNKMKGTFTVSSTGDLYFKVPVSQRMSPQLRDILRNADTTVGNLEGGMSEYPADRAKVIADLGFKLLAPGEDDSVAGYEAREKYLSPLGIKVAGAGLSLTEARRPQFQEVPQGLVAFLAACPGNGLCGNSATDAAGARPAKAGVNQLGLTVWNAVTQQQFDQLVAIRDSIVARRTEPDVLVPSALPPTEAPGRLELFDQKFIVADKPGDLHYELDPADEDAEVLAIRNAKEVADFVIFHMHVHHNRHAFQHYSSDSYPPDYMQPFLHKLIDNGLDMYVGSGNHSMQGIEIYKGRPIFYNQGNMGRDLERTFASPANPGDLTGTERNERVYLSADWNDASAEAYVANTTYKDGRLVEIRIYPVDIALGEKPWSDENIPQTPTPEKARAILERLQKISEPFGTKISIENNIGIIRVPPEATVQIGGDLVIPGRQPKAK